MLTIRSPTWKYNRGRKSLSLGKIKFEKNAWNSLEVIVPIGGHWKAPPVSGVCMFQQREEFLRLSSDRPIRETRRGSALMIKRHGRPLLYFGNGGISYIHLPGRVGRTHELFNKALMRKPNIFCLIFLPKLKSRGNGGKNITMLVLFIEGRSYGQMTLR